MDNALEKMKMSQMNFSHIISTRNRAAQLGVTLSKIDADSFIRHKVELILVDSASDDSTFDVIKAFAERAPFPTRALRADRPGTSIGRNLGISRASGELLIFTDDDCYLDRRYYDALTSEFDPSQHHYGGGSTLIYDPTDDIRIAYLKIPRKTVIPPNVLLHAGIIQGANMFMLRRVLERIGGFSADFGSPTPFIAEDIELATRASTAGYSGLLLPDVVVYHHHGRKPGSKESVACLNGYDVGRGAYYAAMLSRGLKDAWPLWAAQSMSQVPMPPDLMSRLEREFRGAADYLKLCLAKNGQSSFLK